ncbi:raffinose/stachyose/melibiose transport system substrate-binding protein [Microlunatus panaciterrae]|uniref:Raffinose/stachyose/melibiose transport system substrate-binding protein n=1 Tax=Microlunatus panaciterrae TaxID=400768 RepID=A0ABS2RG00_9ACTN|nr:extracellular solute-binding protein [Microlunatus panaciterrae]MBM7797467.1 raffinose/stachyose/melibiose transport system substrate-binding protein [Microlunatus panaciterrae]
MIRTRRGISALLAALLGLALFAGCSGSQGASSGNQSPAAAPKGDLNVVVSSATGSDAGFKAVNKAFAAKYPDVKVKFTAIPNENYAAAHSSRLSAGSIDVGLAGPKELPSYVPASNMGDDARLADAGGLVDLTNQPFMKNYTPTVLDSIKYKGKQYTVPTGLSYYTGVYYNKTIFDKYGLKIPTTWSEFMTVCKTLKSKGVVPLGISGKDSAGVNMLGVVQNIYPTQKDKEDLAKGLWDQSVKLTDGKQLEVLTKVKALYDYAEPNFAGVSYNTMTAGFVKGQFAMMSDGTWNQTTIDAAGGPNFKYGYFPLPSSDNAADNAFLGGKVELTFAVPSNSKNVGAALAYLAFFSEPENYKLFLKEAGFAPSQPNIELTPFYNSIAPYTKTFQPAWDTIWIANTKAGAKAQFPFNYSGIAPLGSQTPEKAAAASQADWAAGF